MNPFLGIGMLNALKNPDQNLAESFLGGPLSLFNNVIDGKGLFGSKGMDGQGKGTGLGNNNLFGFGNNQSAGANFMPLNTDSFGTPVGPNTFNNIGYDPGGTYDDTVGRAFGQEGDQVWSPGGGEGTFHNGDYDWGTTQDDTFGNQADSVFSSMDDFSSDSGNSDFDADWGDDDFGEGAFGDSGGDSGGGDSGGDSYIATAATQALGEDGLTVFNNWREHLREVLPSFTTSWGRYRVTAPKIVLEINKEENPESIYKEIWDKYLKPIRSLILDKKDDEALVDYKEMVRDLQKRFLK